MKKEEEMTEASALDEDSAKKEGSRSGTTLHANDVLCSRSRSINTHPGNENYHRLVKSKKCIYLTAWLKQEKHLIADSIIFNIPIGDPPCWFLLRDVKMGLWH
eukprot:9821873-Ditylum_brightwellii.AAC.1